MNFIPHLEREGGHIAILTSLLIICIGLSLYVPENQFIGKVGDMTLGALLLAMKGNGNGKTAPVAQPALQIPQTMPVINEEFNCPQKSFAPSAPAVPQIAGDEKV